MCESDLNLIQSDSYQIQTKVSYFQIRFCYFFLGTDFVLIFSDQIGFCTYFVSLEKAE